MGVSIISRAGRLLVSPNSEWSVIAGAGSSPVQTGLYAAVMLVMPPLVLVGMGLAGITFRYAAAETVFNLAAAGLVATTLLIFALAGIVRWVVPAFDGVASYGRALTFTIYATTPMWLFAGIGNLFVPVQRVAAVIGFAWAIVLIVKGGTPMFTISQPKRGVFAFTIALSLVVLWLVVLAFVTGFMMAATRS